MFDECSVGSRSRTMLLGMVLLHCSMMVYCNSTVSKTSRIVGGQPTLISKIPYQVALYLNNQFTCGGSLITQRCVLTAGHCVANEPASAFKIRYGFTNLDDAHGQTIGVLRYFIPPKFRYKTLNLDAAVMVLNGRASGTNITTIEMRSGQLKAGDQIQVSGWGATKNNRHDVSNELRVVYVNTVSRERCNRQYPGEIKDSMFCAGVKGGGKDACEGDSGGPAVKDGRQVGIVSWGYGCGKASYSGVYTNINRILPWINTIKVMHCSDRK